MNYSLIKVSFVIIEYNSVDDVMRCVSSLTNNCHNLNYEVIISSNSQYDIEKQKSLVKSYPEIIWSFNEKNGGFAYGMNRGIEKSSGEFIITQNPDTMIINNKLVSAIDLFMSDTEIGIIGPQIVNKSGEVQDTCRPFVTPYIILKRYYYRKFKNRSLILEKTLDYTKTQYVDWVIGAFMIIPKAVINTIGGFDEKYFMYIEDMDLCLRTWNSGFKVIYYPELMIEYEGDRKSTTNKIKYLPISINKYTVMHIKNYFVFLISNFSKIIGRDTHPTYEKS